jgi:peptidoglycan-binding protein ArfA
MPGSEDTRQTTGHRTASTLYRRPPGAAWLVALLAIPLFLALIGWAGRSEPDVDARADAPGVSASATLTAPKEPDVNTPEMNFAPLSIVRSGNGFTLSGELPDGATKTGLLDSLKLAFGPGIDLTDKLNVKGGVNAPDFAALGSIFGASVDIPDFGFDLNGDTVTVTGTAPSDDSKTQVEAAVKAAWPNIMVVNNIEVRAVQTPPSSAPPSATRPAPTPGGAPCATLQADITASLRTPINFETDGFTLTEASRQQLTQIAEKLKACPAPKVAVVGHADDSGNDAINMPLSTNRAKAVADYLVSQGVAAERVASKGVGSSQPVAPNDTPAGKAVNRRVDITVS